MEEFEAIFEKYTPVVYRYLLSLCADPDLAEELTAETFYRAYLHIGRFRGECRVESWLCQIAKHALYKEQKRRLRLAGGAVPETGGTDGGLTVLADREQARQICRQLQQLREPYREVFRLRIFGQLSFKEIARICGKSESWAKVTFYRAKSQLIKEMEEEE